MALKKYIIPLLLLIYIGACEARVSRMTLQTKITEAVERCTKIGDPLIKNSEKYSIPLTAEDITYVCKIYDGVSMCFKNVSTTVFPSTHSIVADLLRYHQDLLQTIFPLCREDLNYQKTYLPYAPCIKQIVMGYLHCGNHYQYLMDLEFHDPHMCCANHKFRECYLKKIHECERQDVQTSQDQNTASEFIGSMMDQALTVRKQLCIGYVPNADNCPLDSVKHIVILDK